MISHPQEVSAHILQVWLPAGLMPSAVLASKCEILPEWVFCGCVMWGHTLQQFGGWFYMFSWGYNCLFNSLYCIKYTTRRHSYLDLSTDYHKPCRKKYSEKDVVTLWPVLLNERCVISLCISSCYFTMGCLNRTGYKHHHTSAKELKNSVAAGDCSVLFPQKSGRIIMQDSQSWRKLSWWFRAGVHSLNLD